MNAIKELKYLAAKVNVDIEEFEAQKFPIPVEIFCFKKDGISYYIGWYSTYSFFGDSISLGINKDDGKKPDKSSLRHIRDDDKILVHKYLPLLQEEMKKVSCSFLDTYKSLHSGVKYIVDNNKTLIIAIDTE